MAARPPVTAASTPSMPNRLERDPKQGCAPVYPWNFVRTNTIFGVIHGAGGYTAWSDKHPSYSSVSGPGNGTNVDDYYSPEINSTVVALPGVVTPTGLQCSPIPDPSQTSAWTNSFQNIQCYDTLKVNAILNEIDGKTHNGQGNAPVPTMFGMNFQAVSVGQKLIETNVGTGGYVDAAGTPTTELLERNPVRRCLHRRVGHRAHATRVCSIPRSSSSPPSTASRRSIPIASSRSRDRTTTTAPRRPI